MKKISALPQLAILLCGCVLLLGQVAVRAQTATGWTGASTGYWNNSANWTSGIPYLGNSSTRIVNFGPLGNAQNSSTNDVTSVLHLFQIFFNAGATNYTLYLGSGGAAPTLFDFSSNIPKIENDSTNTQTINMPFGLSGINVGSTEIDASSGNIVLTANAAITLAVTNTQLRFYSSAGHTVTLNAPILGGASNSCALMGTATAGASGTFVIFAGTNTCTNTFVNAGTARLAVANFTTYPLTVGDTNITTTSPAVLQMDNGLTNTSALVVRMGSTNSRTIGNTTFGSGTADFAGPLSLGTNLTTLANSAGTLEFDGNVDFQNPGGVPPRTLTVAGSGNTLFTGNFTNAATGISVLTKTNSGTLTLDGTTNAVRILYDIGGGVISITNSGAIGIPTGVNYPNKVNFTASAMLSVTNSFTLGRNASGSDNAGFEVNGGSTGTFDVAAGSTLTLDGPVIDLPGTGSGSLAKTSPGTLILQQPETYSGSTIVSAGQLALATGGSIFDTTNIIISGGAVFAASPLSSFFILGSSQTLSNSTSTATLTGNMNTGSGTLSLTFAAGTPALDVTNGTLTLFPSTGFKVNNIGAALAAGSYQLVAAFNGGAVSGTVPGIAVGGGGTTAAASLQIGSGSLYLVVGANTPALASSENPSSFLDNLTFTATVQTNGVAAGNATGDMTFLASGSPFSTNSLAGGAATSAGVNSLPRGTNTITVVYSGDANYLASTNSLNQVVTNHPPVAGNVTYTRNAAISSYHILISQLLSNVTDADGDNISLTGVSVSTNGIALVNSGGYLFYQNPNPVADQFTYTVTDGFGGTNSGAVNFAIDTNALFGQTTPAISTTNGLPTISFAGIPGYSYSIASSSNLINWNVILTTNAPGGGVFQFTDPAAPQPAAFYRLQYNP